jgi:hypothetical protein
LIGHHSWLGVCIYLSCQGPYISTVNDKFPLPLATTLWDYGQVKSSQNLND